MKAVAAKNGQPSDFTPPATIMSADMRAKKAQKSNPTTGKIRFRKKVELDEIRRKALS
jgi:hypothetical protein